QDHRRPASAAGYGLLDALLEHLGAAAEDDRGPVLQAREELDAGLRCLEIDHQVASAQVPVGTVVPAVAWLLGYLPVSADRSAAPRRAVPGGKYLPHRRGRPGRPPP